MRAAPAAQQSHVLLTRERERERERQEEMECRRESGAGERGGARAHTNTCMLYLIIPRDHSRMMHMLCGMLT